MSCCYYPCYTSCTPCYYPCYVCNYCCFQQTTTGPSYRRIDLTSNINGAACNLDTNLINPWGIAIIGTNFWVADYSSLKITIYSPNGVPSGSPISIIAGSLSQTPNPNGIISNNIPTFQVSNGSVTAFISTQAGTVNAYGPNTSTTALPVIDPNTTLNNTAVYKGLAIATSSGTPYLYIANFSRNPSSGSIDVYNTSYTSVSLSGFTPINPSLPNNYAPFNIVNINGLIYVMYALKNPTDPTTDLPGPGNGLIAIFNPDGTFVKWFALNGQLNSPWSIIPAPSNLNIPGGFLVSNTGDGKILIYDANGNFQSYLKDRCGVPITISGLKTIAIIPGSTDIYFTAGSPTTGTFGRLSLTSC